MNLSIRHINKRLLPLCLLAGLTACSDDIGVFRENETVNPDELTINLSIPDVKIVNTRADDSEIANLMFFGFDSSNALVLSKSLSSTDLIDLTSDGVTKKRLAFGAEKSKINRISSVYVIANANSLDIGSGKGLTDFSGSLTELEDIAASMPQSGLSTPLIMSGSTPVSGNSNVIDLTLTRLSAKISVTLSSDVEGYTLEGINFYNLAQGVTLENPDTPYRLFVSGTRVNLENLGVDEPTYVYPSYGARIEGHASDGAYAVIKVKNTTSDEESYFRIDFRIKGSGTNSDTPLNLEPNHWYKIEILDIASDGHSLEGAKDIVEDEESITYAIHDHSANVYSMISDGIRELGVTPQVKWTTESSQGDKPNFFTIRWYSQIEEETNSWPILEVTEGKEWLEIMKDPGTGEYITDDDATISGLGNEASEVGGVVKKFYLQANGHGNYAVITVSWKGLKRDIVVNRENTTDYSLCNVTLKIYEGTSLKATIEDYGSFIQGQGTGTSKDGTATLSPHLFGVDESAMGEGKSRQGLHFPVMYGNGTPWTYEYVITSTRTETVSGITPHFTDTKTDEVIQTYLSTETDLDNKKITLRFNSADASYTYGKGEIYIIVNYGSNNMADRIYFPVFHTGFFHFDDTAADDSNKGYYYYEVVPMGDSYWLDRNLGAKSRHMLVDNLTSISGDKEARGRYYSVASKPDAFFDDPDIKNAAVCPPGYHVPSTTEWDKVRLDTRFRSEIVKEEGTDFTSTFYMTDNREIGNVYFPMTRYYNLNNSNQTGSDYVESPNSGIGGSGYYWSQDAAMAMEKDEIGGWLRALIFKGGTSSFNNASVANHKMAVRCAKGSTAPENEEGKTLVSFNVHGATHVYLVDGTSGIPIFSFPGKPAVSSGAIDEWRNFYCSVTTPQKDILMLFVKVVEGKVTLFSRSGTTFRDDVPLNEIEHSENFADYAWEVEPGYYYDFCEEAEGRTENVTETKQDGEKDPTRFNAGDRITVHWRENFEGKSHPNISCGDGSWANLMPKWAMPGEKDGSDNRKITFICARDTKVIQLNVEASGEDKQKIRYRIDFNSKDNIKIKYERDDGDQYATDHDVLNEARVEYRGYKESIFGHEYDIYLYMRESETPSNMLPPKFYAGSKITFHWKDEFGEDSEGNVVHHPNIYNWSDVSNAEDLGGFWTNDPGTLDEAGFRSATIENLANYTYEFQILLFDRTVANEKINSTKIKMHAQGKDGNFYIWNAQNEESGSQDLSGFRLTTGDTYPYYNKTTGNYEYDIYLMK
ncbi:MAG: hypothetical protein J1D77_04955 [Muribaculaceae bacterium]|nr:hypothetical protein [Muribaculaceae bacterium]